MSVKAVKKYYDQICDQYKEMMDNIRELEADAENNLVEPERIERLKEQVAPIKENYERISYIMFLLNQPTRKSKQPRYKEANKKFLSTLNPKNSTESVLKETEDFVKKVGKR